MSYFWHNFPKPRELPFISFKFQACRMNASLTASLSSCCCSHHKLYQSSLQLYHSSLEETKEQEVMIWGTHLCAIVLGD